MVKWNLDQEEYYYKVYDAQNQLAGYFQPDYGVIQPREKQDEIIEGMIKRQDHVYGGMLYVPLLKLNLLDEQYDYDLDHVIANLNASIDRTEKWKECINGIPPVIFARVSKSHDDPDMLSVMLGIKFGVPVKLNKGALLDALRPILDNFHDKELL
ncbi:MAG: hypothetical protein V3T40_07495 [Nitrososphaerales archaeon]